MVLVMVDSVEASRALQTKQIQEIIPPPKRSGLATSTVTQNVKVRKRWIATGVGGNQEGVPIGTLQMMPWRQPGKSLVEVANDC